MVELSETAKDIYTAITEKETKLGDLRKLAKTIKMDHDLAMELWSTGHYYARQLAILLMDKNQIDQVFVDQVARDIQTHPSDDKNQLTDWFMANQLSKNKKTIALMQSWQHSPSDMQRRIFWYYQARLRWMGNTNFSNTEDLLNAIEKDLLSEAPEVQWAMNFTAGQIGKWQEKYRQRCIDIGVKTGLYKDEVVAKNCTPSYLPEFIRQEVAKLALLKN